MSDSYVILADGFKGMPDFDESDKRIAAAARMAINRTAQRGRTAAAREMRAQVNFPASYLTGANGRLNVVQQATNENLIAVIRGRHRPTSLARFARETNPAQARKRGGVNVDVKPGAAKFMKGAFLVHLRAGAAKTDTQFNLGLAIRLKPGDSLRNSTAAVRLEDNVYLLYGPSVDQVFRTVRDDIQPGLASFLEAEFRRLVDLGSKQ